MSPSTDRYYSFRRSAKNNVVLLDLKRVGKSKWKRQLAKRGTYSIR
jgi:hypothetical protein